MTDRRVWALLALAAILVITVGWWALALWPLPTEAPGWLVRTRVACFGSTPSGLPDGGGWLLLVGQPAGMLLFLLFGWGGAVRGGLAQVLQRGAGRLAVSLGALALAVGVVAATHRVAGATVPRFVSGPPAADGPRLDEPSPPLRLAGQSGEPVALAGLRGRPVVVTFAYAHCETVCPLIVHDVLAAARAAPERPAVMIVTLDPWRDTPARLPAIAAQWALGDGEFVLSGAVPEVQAVLEAWGVGIARDGRTGDITHARVAWVIDAEGRRAFLGDGRTDALRRQLARL